MSLAWQELPGDGYQTTVSPAGTADTTSIFLILGFGRPARDPMTGTVMPRYPGDLSPGSPIVV